MCKKMYTHLLILLLVIGNLSICSANPISDKVFNLFESHNVMVEREGFEVKEFTREEYGQALSDYFEPMEAKRLSMTSDGCFIGGRYIFVVNESMNKNFVIAHETTHYIQYKFCGISMFSTDRWISEGIADIVAGMVTLSPQLMVDNHITKQELIDGFIESCQRYGMSKVYEQSRYYLKDQDVFEVMKQIKQINQ